MDFKFRLFFDFAEALKLEEELGSDNFFLIPKHK